MRVESRLPHMVRPTNETLVKDAEIQVWSSIVVWFLVLSIGCTGNGEAGKPSTLQKNGDTATAPEVPLESARSVGEKDAIDTATSFLQEHGLLYPECRVTATKGDNGVWRVRFVAVPGGPGQFRIVHIGHDNVVLNWRGGE